MDKPSTGTIIEAIVAVFFIGVAYADLSIGINKAQKTADQAHMDIVMLTQDVADIKVVSEVNKEKTASIEKIDEEQQKDIRSLLRVLGEQLKEQGKDDR